VRGRGVTLTTHSHLVPRSRMSRSYTSSPPQAPPWRVAGLLYKIPFCNVDLFFNLNSNRKELIDAMYSSYWESVVRYTTKQTNKQTNE
jgi:hypothetical protein